MKETQRRIKEYQAKLPRVKEKVVAVMLLLAVSTSMLVTVSFAWVALSTNPEVTGVNTSIASNGNLEIALASGLMTSPNEVAVSAVGDSALPLLERNITWGNLINLSDPAYGLESLVLRPALLNESNLLAKPLRGPVYDASGRVVDMNPNFGYAKKNEYGMFVASNELGIRAITSMKFGESGASTEYYNAVNTIEGANGMMISQYESLANNKSYMNALASMMSGYIVENIYYVKGSNFVQSQLSHAVVEKGHVQQFQYMYADMIELFEEQAEQTAALLTWSAKLEAYGTEAAPPSLTKEELLGLTYSVANKTAYKELKNRGFKTVSDNESTMTLLKEIDQFLADYYVIVEDYDRLQVLYDSISGQSVAWLDSVKVSADSDVRLIDDIISRLVNVGTCTISSSKQSAVQIQNSGGGSILINLVSGTCETKITNGILLRFDNRCGGRIANPQGVPLKITAGSQTVTSNVSTTATDNYFENERSYVYNRIEVVMQGADLIAQDVYGFAVDFWVRTNAQGSYLTLQGNVLTRTDTVEVFGKNREGEDVPLYTITVTVDEGDGSLLDKVVVSYDIYQSTQKIMVEKDDGTIEEQTVACWRYAERHAVVEEEYVSQYTAGKLPPRKVEEVKTVIGYEGDNRIWEGAEHASLTVNSSTQGSGSCYVFYSENPVDQARIKVLLESMKVAFIDDQGELLATASMATNLSYETTGKVIVPLVLDSDSINIGTDNNGDPLYAITVLECNVAKRITAIFYLDGEEITNSEVLASADIRGQMNIQFGSSAALKPLGNETLYNSEIHIDAELEGNTEFDYGVDNDMTTTVKVSIDGTTANRVEAYFIRKINATQGSPEETFTLTDEDQDGIWEGSYTFLYPGEYILRSVRIDGTDRDLPLAEGEIYPTVIVNGYSVTDVSYGVENGVKIMTDAGTYTLTSQLKFATNDPDKMPNKVAGQFLRADGAVATVNYLYDATAGVWRGTATFVSSGEYTMQYVMLDGEYTELSEANRCTVDLTLGMRVKVSTHSPTTFAYKPGEMPEKLYMSVHILDNSGTPVENITSARLYYASGASSELHTDLEWNNSTERYEGELNVASGIWKFSKVVIYSGELGNELRSVNADSPVFTIIPPTPPTYKSSSVQEVQFVRDGAGTGLGEVKVTLKDSEAATVYAKFENGGAVRYVAATKMETGEKQYTYTFPLESGVWKLVSVSAYNVFDKDGNRYSLPTGEDGKEKAVETEAEYNLGLVFGDFEPVSTSVLLEEDIRIDITYADTFDSVVAGSVTVGNFGKDSGGNVTASFMESHSIGAGAMTVKFSDPYGLIGSVFSVRDVVMYYDFDGAPDAKYGGYTADASVWDSATFKPGQIILKSGSMAGTFTNEKAISFQYAGRYTIENANNEKSINYSVEWTTANGTEIVASSKTPNGAYAVEVWSKKVAVNITAVNPNAQIYTKITYSTIGTYTLAEPKTNTIDAANNKVTVYAKAVDAAETGASGVGTGDAGFVRPTVTFAAAGIDSATKVQFTIPKGIGDAKNDPTKAISVALTGTTGGTYTLGATAMVDEKSGCVTNTVYGYYGHNSSQGAITISTVTVVYNGLSFEAQLEKPIIIDNPSSVNQK